MKFSFMGREQELETLDQEQGNWRVFFLGFSRSGWTSGALAYQDTVNRQPAVGANWVSAGLRLLTLDDVDNDLGAWSM